MKIDQLTISNFRGIKGELELEANGGNMVIVGPNGSGKSSVIAAVDFLLTGSIRELSGEGTQSLTERRHAPHVDAEPTQAWVEATFNENGRSCTVRRTVADRGAPEIHGDDELEVRIESIFDAADRGMHLLSRDQILDFVTAQHGTRSEHIRTILNLQNIKSRRLALGNASEYFADEAERFERESISRREDLFDVLEFDKAEGLTVIEKVNEVRGFLGGEPIDDLQESFTEGIESPSRRVVASPLLRTDGRQRIEQIRDWFEDGAEDFLQTDNDFREKVEGIEADAEAQIALERRQLIELGKEAIDPETEQCPLCLTEWDADELIEVLSDRLEQAEERQEELDELKSRRAEAQQQLTDIRVVAESLHETLLDVEQYDVQPLAEFIETISDWEGGYDGSILSEPPHSGLTAQERAGIIQPSELQDLIDEIEDHIAEGPVLDELEDAWQKLQSAENQFEQLGTLARKAAEYRRVADQMEMVHQEFIIARDRVLNRIYREIEEKFESYYTAIHADEEEFDVALDPTSTGLEMEVGFYSRGQHPPHALHSEGHQDSMGICLYMALFDWLQDQEDLSIMMLDDVVMSIDAQHRRPLARLMATEFAQDHQVFITTHDDLWHRHLRSSGVVDSDNAIQLEGWDISEGPILVDQPEMEWETIEQELEAGNISIAAHQTRRMAEWFLREACDRIDGKIPFKADSEWTLGDFKKGVVTQYKDLVGMAKAAANSRNEDMEYYERLEDEMGDIDQRISKQGAAINPNVHWNEGESAFAGITPQEMRAAVEAYRDLYRQLWCEECNSCIRLLREGRQVVRVSCVCDDISWNLRKS